MKFVQISKIESAWDNVVFTTLSPSTFSWVSNGCAYQVMLQEALKSFKNRALTLPSNKNAILGTIIHKIYELTVKGQLQNIPDLINKWEELISIEENNLKSIYPTLSNIGLNDYNKRNKAILYAKSMMKPAIHTRATGEERTTYAERRLDCPNLGLRGIVDKMLIEDGFVDLIDYKSGGVTDGNGNIKKEYVTQLHLYAAMCQDLRIGTPRSLILIDIDGKKHNISYDQVYSNSLLNEVKSTIQKLNSAIKTRDFSSYVKPDLGMCTFCSCRHVCKYINIPIDSHYKTLTGKVEDMPSTNMYALRNASDTIYVSGMDAYSVDNPQEYIGKILTFVNIARASQVADDYTYKVTENTLIYEQL